MKKLVFATGLAAAICFAGSAALAASPCCSMATQATAGVDGMTCDQFDPTKLAGCGELDEQNCIGGGPVPTDDPQAQSPLGGCICVGGTCVSDGSIGDTVASGGADSDVIASDHECRRDAVTGCCANDACH